MVGFLDTKPGNNGAMLAGVCNRLATWLGWNVWAIRAVLLIVLIAKPLIAALGYIAAAILLGALDRSGKVLGPRRDAVLDQPEQLQSPELASRKQRIDELEQRFRNWEQSLRKD
ncbi:MAG TPA: PspC domain-containing protein [Xanthomonadales bacterium]|nr:PspC domain-containing protein [Xanthomonadales bacterium]